MNLKWKEDIRQYSVGLLLFWGKWAVGSAYCNNFKSKNDPLKYTASCKLPGIKAILDDYETEEEAKARVETAVKYWIKHTEDA